MNKIDTGRNVVADLAGAKKAAYEATFERLAPPTFATLFEERQHRKERLAAGFRIFSAFGLSIIRIYGGFFCMMNFVDTRCGKIIR